MKIKITPLILFQVNIKAKLNQIKPIVYIIICCLAGFIPRANGQDNTNNPELYDLIIVGGTPGGIMAAIAADRMDSKVLVLERSNNLGGLPANGLGATDIATRNSTGGLFLEFVNRIKDHYYQTYGADSQQALSCENGYHFEPSVAEQVLEKMLHETNNITIKKMMQFDADPDKIKMKGNRIVSICLLNRLTGEKECFQGKIFIDATYEGDLSAAVGVPYLVGRESKNTYNEPYAGVVYKLWQGDASEGSTFLGDNAIQAYNYRLCLTQDSTNKVNIEKPKHYNRDEYLTLIDDVKTGRTIDKSMLDLSEEHFAKNRERVSAGLPPIIQKLPDDVEGIQRIVNKVNLPNNKVDANNQHMAFISTDLPEENWPWPTSSWDWRDAFAARLKNYILGLIWFAQNDPELPEWFKNDCLKWGLAKNEYNDNDHFPRQVYVREGRRMKGEYFFTAHDAMPKTPDGRPVIHSNSITSSHYPIDSHATRKREKGKASLDGILSYSTQPYTVPYGVIVPEKISNLLMPVPVSASHLGYATLRMEPCWMALGQAAGVAGTIAIKSKTNVQNINIKDLQRDLIAQKAILIFFRNILPDDPQYPVLQILALNGLYTDWELNLDEVISEKEIEYLRIHFNYKIPKNLKIHEPTRRVVFKDLVANDILWQ